MNGATNYLPEHVFSLAPIARWLLHPRSLPVRAPKLIILAGEGRGRVAFSPQKGNERTVGSNHFAHHNVKCWAGPAGGAAGWG